MNRQLGYSRTELAVVLAVLAGTAAVILPLVQASRVRARQETSTESLKYLALGIHNYESVYQRIPTGGWTYIDGNERFGWPTVLLPYVSHAPVFNRLNLHEPWHHRENRPHVREAIHYYLIPGSSPVQTSEGYAFSQYSANASLMHRNSSLRFSQIKNGLGNTLLIGETLGEFRPWGCSWNWRPVKAPLGGPDTFGSQNSTGTLFVLANGQVKMINRDIDPTVLQKLADSGYTPPNDDIVRPPIPEQYPAEQ